MPERPTPQPAPTSPTPPTPPRDATRDDPGLPSTLWAIFTRFLGFGLMAWGGPVAQIGMLKQELVDDERWVEPDKFNRVLAVYQALPGPEALELCCYFGTLRAGRLGGLVAGIAFLAPGLVFMLVLASLYRAFGLSNPWVLAAMAGAQPAAVALVVRAVYKLSRDALDDLLLWIAAIVALLAALAGVHFAFILLVCGAALAASVKDRLPGFFFLAALATAAVIIGALDGFVNIAAPVRPGASPTVDDAAVTLPELFLTGLKGGVLSFGGAYTALPFLQGDAVEGPHAWMTHAQFLDGLALAGVIPAPLVIVAAFVGHMALGLPGGLVCAAAIVLPAFAFTLLGHRYLEALVEDQRTHALLAGVTAGVIGLIAATAIEMFLNFRDARAWIFFVVALAALLAWSSRWATPIIILTAAAAGLIGRAVSGA